MDDDFALDAIGRIDKALARIERVAERGTPAGGRSDEVESLRRANQKLRSRIEDAIEDLDRLLALQETG